MEFRINEHTQRVSPLGHFNHHIDLPTLSRHEIRQVDITMNRPESV